MVIGYTTIDRILAKFQRDYGIQTSESDLIEWAGEALEAIGATRLYQENVTFAEVNNFQCELPNYLYAINQIAKDTKWNEGDKNTLGICPAEVILSKTGYVKEEDVDHGPEPDYPVCLDDCGMPIDEYELAYYRPFFDLMWDYPQWKDSPLHQRFVPVIESTNNFFHHMVCENDVCSKDFGMGCEDEYKIIDGTHLRFSFQNGMVAISYLKYRVDEKTGYPMIPDNEVYTTAITKYCIMKYTMREFYNGREGSAQRMEKADMDWQWYCGRAKNAAKMPTLDDYENMLRQRHRLVTRTDRYQTFFGKLNKKEDLNIMMRNQRRNRIVR